jgi:AraC family transcriptional regulator
MEHAHRESSFSGGLIASREFPGFQLLDGVYRSQTRLAKHSHEEAILCIALKGVCREHFLGKVREYEPMTVQFLPPHQSHSLDFPSELRAFSVDITTSWLERARDSALMLDTSVHSRGGLLSTLMIRLYKEFLQTDDAAPLAIEGLTLELLAEVSRRQSKLSGRAQPRWLKRALDLLRARFSERITIMQVAAAVDVHPVHLAREFRRFHDCTIGEYIRRLRIEHACEQLNCSDESLAAIAAGAGFSDQSHSHALSNGIRG